MDNLAIKFENISKQYRLGTIGTGTLSHDLNRWWTVNIRGKEDPYLKIGSVNERTLKSDSDYVWALRNIDLEIKQGEVLGIIGKNGAGKSTLLKILSRVTSPTTGRIIAKGRIASLLEVGTGFHPEMTGRENIFMNGSIMGMTKSEIKRKMDEIVYFAGVERFIDTPVKRYSSGMIVRLGFAIAAHLEPEILVIDEVLAVGDAEFQKKAVGKMQDVSSFDGRTVLFVSHNMGSIKSLCSKSILLENGGISFFGDTASVIEKYTSDSKQSSSANMDSYTGFRRGDRSFAEFNYIEVLNCEGKSQHTFGMGESIKIRVGLNIKKAIKNAIFGVLFRNSLGNLIHDFRSSFDSFFPEFKEGMNVFEVTIPEIKVYPGHYVVGAWIQQKVGIPSDDYFNEALTISIIDKNLIGDPNSKFEAISKEGTEVYHPCKWKLLDGNS